MDIKVTKLTDLSLLQKANSVTTGRESKMDLAKAYRLGHSPIRTQMFLVELYDAPAFVVGHLVRHIHAIPFVQSKRTDRGGEDFRDVCADLAKNVETNCLLLYEDQRNEADKCIADEIRSLSDRFDRYAPQSIALLLNAEEIINISRKRLCAKASAETREIWEEVIDKVSECDPDLAKHCVKHCVHCGFCREAKPCGYMRTNAYKKEREEYLKLFE